MKKYLWFLVGLMVSGGAWARCPDFTFVKNAINDADVGRINRLDDVDSSTIYFCASKNVPAFHWVVSEDELLQGTGITHTGGVASIGFGGVNNSVFGNAPIDVGSVTLTGAGIPNANLSTNIKSNPHAWLVLRGHRGGAYNFFQRYTPSSTWTNGDWNDDNRKSAVCGTRDRGQYGNIIEYLRNHTNQVFDFDGTTIDPTSLQWQSPLGDEILRAKVLIKSETNNSSSFMPAIVSFHWVNENVSGQFFARQGQGHMFCWVSIGTTITLDSSHQSFGHAGAFKLTLGVNTL